MIIKNTFVGCLCLLFPVFFWGQIRVSEHIQQSAIATEEAYGLYFVDFWATWCGPCIPASKYIESLQKQYPDAFFVLSLSQENPEVVKRFMDRHNNGLAVAIDYEGQAFKQNKVSSLPYGILYNAKGDKLWEGHPANFKKHHIQSFLRHNHFKIPVDEMIKLQAYKKTTEKEDAVLDEDFEITELADDSYHGGFLLKKHHGVIELKGNLKAILAYVFVANESQIQLADDLDKPYRVVFKEGTRAYANPSKAVLKVLKLKYSRSQVNGEALAFEIENPTFWDTDQINWGGDTPHFLIGDAEIKADNVSLNDLRFQLSKVLEIPIIIRGEGVEEDLHDWEVHYKYFDLMKSNMKDSYGITVKKEALLYPIYTIVPRR